MILEKRKIHFYSAIALAIVLPILFIWGIVARPFYNIQNQSFVYGQFVPEKTEIPAPSAATISKQLSAPANRAGFPKVRANQLFLNAEIKSIEAKPFSLAITPQSILKFPDPLLYWQPGREAAKEIAPSMILLGSLPGKASNIDRSPRYIFDLPPQAFKQDGSLVLYSQGYNAIAASFPLCLHNSEKPFVCKEN